MSRSYKKSPWSTDGSPRTTKENKRIAAGRIRNLDPESLDSEALSGKSARFKKINKDTYDIHDWRSRWTREEAIDAFENELNPEHPRSRHSRYGTLENFLNEVWAKSCKRK